VVVARGFTGGGIDQDSPAEQKENAAVQHQQQQQEQEPNRRRRRLRNGGGIFLASVTAAAAAAATTTTTSTAPGNTNEDATTTTMTLPPAYSRPRPARRSTMPHVMPSSFGGVGPTLGHLQVAHALLAQQQQQHGTTGMMPPLPREAKRRRSIATSTAVDDDFDPSDSGRSTPLRSNSSGGSAYASASASRPASTVRAAANPFAIDLDGPRELLAEDLLQRTYRPLPGQLGYAEHVAGLFLKDVASSASSSAAAASRRSFGRRMTLPPTSSSPRARALSRQLQMGRGGLPSSHHAAAARSSSVAAAAYVPGTNRDMMQLLRAQHQQLQMQWQARACAKAGVEAEAEAQQEGAAVRHRQQRRSELSTSSGGGSAGTNFSPSSAVASTSSPGGRSGRVPPPFAFQHSLSDRSLGGSAATDTAAGAAAGASTDGGLQRFKKRPAESIYANEVEMADTSSHHPEGDGTEDDEVCIEIHTTTTTTTTTTTATSSSPNPTGGHPPASPSGGPAAASVRITAGTASSHSVSPASDDSGSKVRSVEDAAAATIRAPTIRFFNNGVEVNDAGVPIVSPAVPANPVDQAKVQLSSQSQHQATSDKTTGFAAGGSSITTNTSSPFFAAQNSAKDSLSRSCSVTDVISLAAKRVPELAKRMDTSDENANIDDVLRALYAIAGDVKSEASPKAPVTDPEARQVRQAELLQARLSTTIRSVERYRRGKAAEGADGKGSAAAGASRRATAAESTAAAAVGPHTDLISQIFGDGRPKHRASANGWTKRPDADRPALEESSGSESTIGASASDISLDNMVRDSINQREMHVDAATALLAFSSSVGGGETQ
jgi:hypothetical protein